MLAALTANINRAEGADPYSSSSFLPYPSVASSEIKGMSPAVIAIFLSGVPSVPIYMVTSGMRQQMLSTYIWASDKWMY